jgi:UDP-glucose 4-epimerase
MTKVVVTGAAGFIGSHLSDALVAEGYEVCGIDDFSTGKRENIEQLNGGFRLVEGDITDEDTVRECLEGAELVFHQAALASVPRSIDDPVTTGDVNVIGTLNLLEQSRKSGVRRFVYASSSSVYGDSETLPKMETMPANPLSPYAVSKLVGEYNCRVFSHIHGMETVSLRYFNVFGPRQDPDSQYAAVVPIFIRHLLESESPTIYGDGEQSRDFTYVENVVRANINAARSPNGSGETFNVACGEKYTVNELFSKLKTLSGGSSEAVYDPPRPGDVKHSMADIGRAEAAFDYKVLVGFEEGLRLTVEWYKSKVVSGND